jgi:UMF1 family MFS transporter
MLHLAKQPRQVWAWAFYDWANSAFVTNIMVAFFPIFFRDYWAKGALSSEAVTLQLGTANSIASISIMVLAPILGAIADQGGLKKRLLMGFAILGISATLILTLITEGAWQLAVTAFILGVVGWLGANIFYDSLLVDITEEAKFNQVSAFGYSVGYLGGGLLLAFSVFMSLNPGVFGFSSTIDAVRWVFTITAIWWALFSIPLLLWVQEKPRTQIQRLPFWVTICHAFGQLWATFKHIRRLRTVGLFLLAYWFYIDGVDTIITMAVDYGKALNFPTSSLITALLVTQFVAFPAALGFGWLGNKVGAQRGILLGIGLYALITIGASQMTDVVHFYFLAGAVGLVQGGVQALSRSFYASLIPAEQAAEFFGFYNMLGKFAAVIGPSLVGWTSVLTGSHRLGLLSVLVLFALGAAILVRVPDKLAH